MATRPLQRAARSADAIGMKRRVLTIACVLLLVAPLAGCWVLDELDNGSKLMDDHASTHSKKMDEPEKKEGSSPATAAKKDAVNAYFKGEEEDGTIKTFTPGSVSEGIVSCKLAGSLQFMKREQCAARGGRAK